MNKVYLIHGYSLEKLKTMATKSIDFLIADPPFGLKGEEPIEEVLEVLKEADRVCKNMIILMDWRNFWRVDQLFHEKKVGELVWEYGWVSGGRTKAKVGFFPTHNTIGLYGDKNNFRFIKGSIIKRDRGLSSPRQCSFAKKSGHRYEKPTGLTDYLLDNIKNCNSVLDCFMGSGSTGVSAIKRGVCFTGIEKELKWFLYSKNRLKDNNLS